MNTIHDSTENEKTNTILISIDLSNQDTLLSSIENEFSRLSALLYIWSTYKENKLHAERSVNAMKAECDIEFSPLINSLQQIRRSLNEYDNYKDSRIGIDYNEEKQDDQIDWCEQNTK